MATESIVPRRNRGYSVTASASTVDLIIPSKDRAMQLHLLLESMGKHLRSMGRITITWQGSNDNFIAGYELLKKRVLESPSFSSLRQHSKEIIFRQRNSLREVYDAAMDSGNSDYIMPLVDDDVFIRDYDLLNDPASKYFYEHDDTFACAIRLGDNLSEQVSHSLDDGILHSQPRGHGDSVTITGKPKFIYPVYGYMMSREGLEEYHSKKYLVFDWRKNLNVSHWSCFTSVTSMIYRKRDYVFLINKFGKNNFLRIEALGRLYYMKKAVSLSAIYYTFCFVNYLLSFMLAPIGKTYNNDLLNYLYAFLSDTFLFRKNIGNTIVVPKESVVAMFGSGGSNNRKNIGDDINVVLNDRYLSGKILDLTTYSSLKILTCWNIYMGEFIDYK